MFSIRIYFTSYPLGLTNIGLNTDMVESLTSYISRLAEAHHLCVSTLVEKVLAPLLDKNYLIKGKGSRFYDYSIEINAFGTQVTNFTQTQSALTGMDCLHKLSLLPLRDVFPSWNVLTKTKRWCPIRLDEWMRNDSVVYEPLLWNFRSTCPSCAKALQPLRKDFFPIRVA